MMHRHVDEGQPADHPEVVPPSEDAKTAEVRASCEAHTCGSGAPDAGEEAIAAVKAEIFGDVDEAVIPDIDRAKLRPEYTIQQVDPNELVIPFPNERDGVLLSGVACSLDAIGIVIPPMVMRRADGKLHVLLGQGRLRVCWARDRRITSIPVVVVKLDGVPAWLVLREVAIEDLRRARSTHRFMEWHQFFRPIIETIHGREAAKRKLLADAKRSRAMLARRSGLPTDQNKFDADTAESWNKRKFGDPVSECKNDDAFAKSDRFKYPLTVSLFFREAFSESTARRILAFKEGLESDDPAIKRLDLAKRLSGLAEGEYSADGIERKLRDVQRIEQLKKKLRKHRPSGQPQLTEDEIQAAIKWIFGRIKCHNLWIWRSVNLGFGMLRRLAELKAHYRLSLDLTKEEAEAYVYGEYPGADVPLNLMAHLTRPGDLVVDLFAGSGATGDAARHFLDPRWRGQMGQWIWWNHWIDLYSGAAKNGGQPRPNLNETVFPPDYWDVDHSRKCLQFDIEPNPLAIAEYGADFILSHDVTNGITSDIVERVREVSSEGGKLIYLDPPYLSQADYTSGAADNAIEEPRQLAMDLPELEQHRWVEGEDVAHSARTKAAAKASETNLCRMSVPQYVRVMARLLIECERILAPDGRIALFMGLDAREGTNFDPAVEIFKAIEQEYDRLDQVPFELDRTGPLYEKVWVPSHGYGLGQQMGWKKAEGQLANVHRHLWILKRRDKGSVERLV